MVMIKKNGLLDRKIELMYPVYNSDTLILLDAFYHKV